MAVGALIGMLFGFFAHRSRFCLRSAVIEFSRGTHEGKLTVWLFTFASAVLLTQAFILAGWLGELKLEGFQDGQAMRRYIAGAMLMGFGGMLAGGCAVGAGVSGAAVFTLTSFVTLAAIWGAAMLTDAWVDRRTEQLSASLPVAALPGADPEISASYARP